jgi:hypothetical protein
MSAAMRLSLGAAHGVDVILGEPKNIASELFEPSVAFLLSFAF